MKLFAGRLFAGRQFVGKLFGRPSGNDGQGIRGGFDVDFTSPLWWKRKPRALEPVEAKERLQEAAAVIVAKAKDHAQERPPVAQRRADVKQAVSPLLASMPGFDWRPMYEAAYSWALALTIGQAWKAQEEAKAAIARAMLREEEEIALLMMVI